MKQFPAFRTRFFYFSKEKNKKELKQLLQSGLGILLFCIFFDSKKIVNINKRHAEFISVSHQQENYGKSGCDFLFLCDKTFFQMKFKQALSI
ncbi:hypothetical protein [Tenacibaculum finnmarkense]|uniref:hypothetical protein n=1 Tax=Tenacibaculum finnmarkense TaxID=2781243 RepID=UPI00187B3BF2|nr:hypothetical protein [Tenacibaculum finnmarkense]MBE7632974.1 hypothetical protein [Tenacibaculum finnmarkense genomovar ulcerans]MBE7697073.1 hypothetical protein [Tenacibaculum finnmarkense genomovar ulcerans]MCD8428892.1 hypothetical protein [Tenacibaculum finnmarkense genomovar ulcerans]MCG8235417.1 hypothetical protein [Tenacibaculum finnmarkense genomovar ulcerans]MCG8829548.1 hypothetical protein [Tenacibaculum finnmarkense]